MKHWIRLAASAALAASATLCLAGTAPPQYQLTVLGTFGHTMSSASGISENGILVGNTYDLVTTPQGNFYLNAVPFMYDHGTSALLPIPADLGVAAAYGVNSGGRTVGSAFNIADTEFGPTGVATSYRAISTQAGVLDELGGSRSMARAINDAGVVVGRSRFGNSNHAARFDAGGQVIDLGLLAGGSSSVANAVNDAGEAAGYSLVGNSRQVATLFSQGQAIGLGPAGDSSVALGMNNQGLAVGWTGPNDGSGAVQAALFDHGQVTLLGTLGGLDFSEATDINNKGWIVGMAIYSDRLENIPFLRIDGDLIDLNTLVTPASKGNWLVSDAYAINDAGQIAGGVMLNGVRYAALLTPVPELPIPALMVLGLALLGGRTASVKRRSQRPAALPDDQLPA